MGAAAMPAAAVANAAAATATYLRIGEAPDAVLLRASGTALGLAEAFCGQMLVARDCEERMRPRAGWQRLAAMPVRGITGGAGLGIDIDAGGVGWVKVDGGEIVVRYSAGLAAAWEALPEAVMQGVVLLAAHLFERRDGDAMPPRGGGGAVAAVSADAAGRGDAGMSAATVLHAAVLAHLKATCRVFDAPTARAAMPVAVLGEAVLGASDAAGVSGRTGTIVVDYVDTGESPARLRALVGAVEAAAAGVPRALGEGWQLTGLRLTKSRIQRGKGDRWVASSEFAVRMYRVQ